MTIAEARTSCKAALGRTRAYIGALSRDVLVVGVFLLASISSFGLGIETGQGMGAREATSGTPEASATAPAALRTEPGQVVASRNGTKYYLPSCSGASRIAAANKVTFASVAAAEAAGYSPAANCKGI